MYQIPMLHICPCLSPKINLRFILVWLRSITKFAFIIAHFWYLTMNAKYCNLGHPLDWIEKPKSFVLLALWQLQKKTPIVLNISVLAPVFVLSEPQPVKSAGVPFSKPNKSPYFFNNLPFTIQLGDVKAVTESRYNTQEVFQLIWVSSIQTCNSS